MNPVLLAQILSAAVSLAEEGTDIYNFLVNANSRVQAAQTTGGDLTADDWAYLDTLAAQNVAKMKGYGSLSEALAAAPAQGGTGQVASASIAANTIQQS